MVQALLISVFLVVLLRDGVAPVVLIPPTWMSHPGMVAALAIAPMLTLWLVADLAVRRYGRMLDRTGRGRLIRRADAVLNGVRLGALALHTANVFALGWLELVRGAVGDLVLVDELLAVAPVLAVFVLAWWSIYPIDRRLREALLIRELDTGRPIHAPLSRAAFVWQMVRHQMLLIVVPVSLVLAWSEMVQWGAERWQEARAPLGWLAREVPARPNLLSIVVPMLQLGGVVVVFGAMPLLLRHLWDTVRLSAQPLRDQLIGLCRAQRVRVRDLLVWRTHGTMINGAVIGLFGRVRYILLTDALLDSLSTAQIEAVAAHEVGHVRRRHMVWLAVAAVAGVLGAASAAGALEAAAAAGTFRGLIGTDGVAGLPAPPGVGGGWTDIALTGVVLGVGLVVFGVVSRRFEWQADAFAVQHLSGLRPEGTSAAIPADGVFITAGAVAAMSDALQAVADLNYVPVRRFSWRHGSILSRQRRLWALVGQRADRLVIDRQVAVVKATSALVLAGAIVFVGLDSGWW